MANVTEREWHKLIIQIIIPVLTLLLALVGAYYQMEGKKQERIKDLEAKIKAFVDKREELKRTPTLDVKLRTLKTSGLPREAFSNLPSIPAVIEIDHAGGGTVRDITITVTGNIPFLPFVRQAQAGRLTYRFYDNRKTLKLEIPELRRDEKLSLTTYQHGLDELQSDKPVIGEGKTAEDVYGPLQAETSSSSGPEHQTDAQDDSSHTQTNVPGLSTMTLETALNMLPEDFKTVDQLTQAINALKWIKRSLDEPLFHLSPSPALISVLAVIVWGLFTLVADYFDYRKKLSAEDLLGRLNVGMNKSVVETWGLRAKGDVYSVVDAGPLNEVWVYKPYQGLFIRRETRGAELLFHGDQLTKIYFLEYS